MKLKIGTRVIVEGEETFISELHKDMIRGVYKVRTSNPTYEFVNIEGSGTFTAVTCPNKRIELIKASKYGNYRITDRVFCLFNGLGVVTNINNRHVYVKFTDGHEDRYETEGILKYRSSKPTLKKLRVKV